MLLNTKFANKEFQVGVKKSFVDTDCYPASNLDIQFVKFTYSNILGTLKFEPKGTDIDFFSK